MLNVEHIDYVPEHCLPDIGGVFAAFDEETQGFPETVCWIRVAR